MQDQLTETKADYDDIVQAIRRTQPDTAEATLDKMGIDLRQSIVNNELDFETTPLSYAALAFRKQIVVLKKHAVLKHQDKTGEEALAAIQGKGCIQIHPGAATAWKHLMNSHREALWTAVALTAMGDPAKQAFTAYSTDNEPDPETTEETEW